MGIPHEPSTLFIYALLVVSGWAIWRGSRPAAPPTPNEGGHDAKTVETQ